MEKEIEYLCELICKNKYVEIPEVHISKEKHVYGYVGGKSSDEVMGKLFQMKTYRNTVIDLDIKIKISLTEALQRSYSESISKNFNPFSKETHEEVLVYYFLENAIFRVFSLWDTLAHMYNIMYEIGVKPRYLNYYSFIRNEIKGTDKEKVKLIKHNLSIIEEELLPIKAYLEEEEEEADNDILGESKWKGNHECLRKFRNKMTHRNAATVSTISNADVNIKSHPIVILNRVVEDYCMVSSFINSLLTKYVNEFESNS